MEKIFYRFRQIIYIFKYFLILIFVYLFNVKQKDIWLISERGDEARDNGYSFYKYLKKYHNEINVKYVITKDSSDFLKINKSDVVIYRSLIHYYYYIVSKVLISTHIEGTSPEFHSFTKLDRKGLLKNRGIQVFMQHGITKDYISLMEKKYNPSIDLFICGAKKEYDFLIKKLGYDEEEMIYTGFSRFDYLKGKTCSQILLMPTWRNYLHGCSENDFIKSEYYNKYQSLINNKKLIEILEKNNINLIFYPHYEVQKFLSNFSTSSSNIIIASMKKFDVQDLLIKSNLLITDYSSVFFDFSYMRKPVLYYQFDYDLYRKTQYAEGYFSYKKDGFGKIVEKEDILVENVSSLIKNKFDNSEVYIKRVNDFFKYCDFNNSKRIYDEIMIKLEKRDSYERQ